MRPVLYLCYSVGCFGLALVAFFLLRMVGPSIVLFDFHPGLQESRSHVGLWLLLLLFALVVALAGGAFSLFSAMLWSITDHSDDERA